MYTKFKDWYPHYISGERVLGDTKTHTEGWPCEDTGRNWSDEATSQGLSRILTTTGS